MIDHSPGQKVYRCGQNYGSPTDSFYGNESYAVNYTSFIRTNPTGVDNQLLMITFSNNTDKNFDPFN